MTASSSFLGVGPWDLPHLDATIYRSDLADPWATEAQLVALEDQIPGLLAWAVPEGWKPPYKKRLRKLRDDLKVASALPPIGRYLLQAPLNAAWLVEDALGASGLPFFLSLVGGVEPAPSTEEERRRLLLDGLRAVGVARRAGLLTEAADCALPYQYAGVGWIMGRSASMLVHPAGSGKTLCVLLALAAREAAGRQPGALVVCPARARPGWAKQARDYTRWAPFRLLPEGMAGEEAFPGLREYLGACRERGAAPLVIVGAESVQDHLDVLSAWGTGELRDGYGRPFSVPGALVVDEIHEVAGDPRRWSALAKPDGTLDFTHRTTARSGTVKRTVAAMLLSRLPVEARITVTATPMGQGLPRRLYGPLDVTWPGGFGLGYRAFAQRYCKATQGQYGMVDEGADCMDELKARASFLVHEVAHSESHRDLPPLRVELAWLGADELERADAALDREYTTKAKARDFTTSSDLAELQCAAAAARKRGWVLRRVLDGLRGGGKVVLFANRHDHVERWAKEIEKGVEAENKTGNPLGEVRVAWGHGDHPPSPDARAGLAAEFAAHPGSMVFVGTGQAFGSSINGFEHADLAIIAALPWRADELVQWRGRFDRHGGRATLLSIPLARGTYDETVATTLARVFGPIEELFTSEETQGMREKLLRREDPETARKEVLAALGLGAFAEGS